MLKLTLLCNAGIALDDGTDILLVDVPNMPAPPFYCLPEDVWLEILKKVPPYDRVKGFIYTHSHADHYCPWAVKKYCSIWPDTPVRLPRECETAGELSMGGFRICYWAIPHAPLPDGVPPHVVVWIEAGEKSVYVTGDAEIDLQAHQRFLNGRKADCALWNAKYLSHAETRKLMQESAKQNLIYHMPADRPDPAGMWKKAERNFARYVEELQAVSILGEYPTTIIL